METKIAVAILLAALFLITPTPEIDSITPDHGFNNGLVEVTIEGKKFDNEAAVKLVKPGEADLNAINVKVVSKKQIKCAFYLGGRSAGKWNVVVTNSTRFAKKAKTATLEEGFTIEYPAPTLTAVDPKTGLNSEILTLNLSGTNFRTGAKVELIAPDQKIIASKVKVISGTQIAAEVDLTHFLPGSYDLKLINDDGKAAMLTGGFTIAERQLVKPSISAIVPNEGYNNGILATEIYGENFDPGASVKLVGAEGEEIPGIDIIAKNAREISCSFDLNQEQAGSYDVVVINPDGFESILPSGLMVKEPSHQGSKVTLKPVFFDFDKSEIRPDQMETLAANLKSIIESPDTYLLLGGHADERGTREYNFGLSERRAEAVRAYLLEKGVDSSKITIYAYGEDYPFLKGHDEQSWSYNRRVDIIIADEPLSKDEGIMVNLLSDQAAQENAL